MQAKLRILAVTATALGALAGCGSGDVSMQPGRYETKATVLEVNIPGAPPEVAEMMKAAAQRTHFTCLTEQDVANPGGKLAPRQQLENCAENSLEWQGGRISGKMRCNLPQGAANADMTGSYTQDSFNMEVKTEMALPGKANERGNVSLRAEGRRVGDCDGSEKAK